MDRHLLAAQHRAVTADRACDHVELVVDEPDRIEPAAGHDLGKAVAEIRRRAALDVIGGQGQRGQDVADDRLGLFQRHFGEARALRDDPRHHGGLSLRLLDERAAAEQAEDDARHQDRKRDGDGGGQNEAAGERHEAVAPAWAPGRSMTRRIALVPPWW